MVDFSFETIVTVIYNWSFDSVQFFSAGRKIINIALSVLRLIIGGLIFSGFFDFLFFDILIETDNFCKHFECFLFLNDLFLDCVVFKFQWANGHYNKKI